MNKREMNKYDHKIIHMQVYEINETIENLKKFNESNYDLQFTLRDIIEKNPMIDIKIRSLNTAQEIIMRLELYRDKR